MKLEKGISGKAGVKKSVKKKKDLVLITEGSMETLERSWVELRRMVMTFLLRLSFMLQILSSNVYYFYNQKTCPINIALKIRNQGGKTAKRGEFQPRLESEVSMQGKHRGTDFECNFFAFFGDVRNR